MTKPKIPLGDMLSAIDQNDFDFSGSAIYKILIYGELDSTWSDRFMGMQIKVLRNKGTKSITSLIGKINDQSALSGVLNNLNNSHVHVI